MRKDYRGERERPTSSWNRAVHGRMRLAGAGIKLAPRIERRVVHTRWTDRTTATRPAIPPGWRPPIQQIANPTQFSAWSLYRRQILRHDKPPGDTLPSLPIMSLSHR